LLDEQRAIGLRYLTDLQAPEGAISYHVVYDNNTYLLGDLPKKARYDVRRGMKSACVEPISFSRLASEGWQLRLETLERQGRLDAETRQWWEKLCISAEGLPGFESWATIVDGKLAAALLAFTCDHCCSILYQQSRSQHLPLSVNNALTFVFTNEILKRSPNNRLFYGLHSLDAPSSVDEFKFRMGYTAKPIRQRVVFHKWLAPFMNNRMHRVVGWLKNKLPRKPTIAKAEGLLRFYLQGQLPLERQQIPKALAAETLLSKPLAMADYL
jgi:hypothetical protein